MSTRLTNILSPYVGPRPFERRHTKLFFGRNREAKELLARVTANQIVLVYAQSGVGKTSLLSAGLIPLLEKEQFEVLPVARVRGLIPDDVVYDRISNPFAANTLISWASQETDPRTLLNTSLSDYLKKRPHRVDTSDFEQARVIIFDQFEELFSFYLDRWDQREDFFKQIVKALAEDDLLRVVFVMREDFVAQLDPYASILPGKLKSRFRLEPMSPQAALTAVVDPLRDTNRTYAPGVAEKLVEELTKVRVETQEGATRVISGEFVEPVQLQVVCQNLWQHLPANVLVIDQKQIDTFGDIDEALSKFYEESLTLALKGAKIDEQTLRRWFDNVLITSANTRGTVYQEKEETGGIPNIAVKILEDQHIIRAETRAGGRWYELTHDRFIEPIQKSNMQWGLSKETEKREEQQRLLREQLQQKFLQRATIGSAIFTVIALLLAAFAFSQANSATNQANNAQTQVAVAATAQNEAVNQAVTATIAQGQALIEAGNAQTQAAIAATAQDDALSQANNAQTQVAIAATAQNNALNQAITATVAQGEAIHNAATSDANAATALAAQQTAAYAQQEANSAAEHSRGLSLAAFSLVALEQNDAELALALVWEANKIVPDSPEVHNALTRIAYNATTLLKGIIQGEDSITDVVVLNDDRTIIYSLIDTKLIQWDIVTNMQIKQFEGEVKNIHQIAVSHDDSLVAAVGDSGVVVWEVETGNQIYTDSGDGSGFISVVFSPNEPLAAIGNKDGEIMIWNGKTSNIIDQLRAHSGWVRALAFSPGGNYLLSGTCACNPQSEAEIILWDVHTGELLSRVPLADIDITSLTFHPDGHHFISGGSEAIVMGWDITVSADNNAILNYLSGIRVSSAGIITDMVFNPAGTKIYIGRDIAYVNSADIATIFIATFQPAAPQNVIRAVGRLEGHRSGTSGIDINSNGDLIFSASSDESIRLWSSGDASERLSISIDCGCPINSIDLSEDEKDIIIGTHGNDMQLWALESKTQTRQFVQAGEVSFVAYSPDESAGLTIDKAGQLAISELNTDTVWLLPRRTLVTASLPTAAVFIDDENIIVGYADGKIIKWNIEEMKSSTQFMGHGGQITSLTISYDGSQLLSAAEDNSAILWDIESGKGIRVLTTDGGRIYDTAFSRDGQTAITAHELGVIVLWQLSTGNILQTFESYSASVHTIAFHPNERFIVSGSSDGKIRLWDIESGQFVRTFQGHTSTVTDLVFFNDASTLLSTSLDRTVRLWQVDLSEQEIVSWVEKNVYIRELTCEEREKYSVIPYCAKQ